MDNTATKTVDLYNKVYLDKGQVTIDGVPLKHIQRFEVKNAHWTEKPEVTLTIKADMVNFGYK